MEGGKERVKKVMNRSKTRTETDLHTMIILFTRENQRQICVLFK